MVPETRPQARVVEASPWRQFWSLVLTASGELDQREAEAREAAEPPTKQTRPRPGGAEACSQSSLDGR